jgi:7,8-dihydropterin-6-yl-methyl-4-(beta-D-ribofuranosyl)aminobenzene 5'-phosphate synthase
MAILLRSITAGELGCSMDIRITTLIENTAMLGFIGEWGLSMLIETDHRRILLDTGPGISTVYNASLLGIDFNTIDRVVLSHGHYDHTGGLKEVLRRSSGLDIISHPSIWEQKYAVRENRPKYIGIPFHKEELESLGARFTMSNEPIWITDNIVTSGEIPLTTPYEEVGDVMHVMKDGELMPDDLPDDLALAIRTVSGLVIILGCAHRGMINTIRHFQKVMGEERVNTVVGGTHLIDASHERLTKTATELKKIGVRRLGVCHCTGFKASAWLAKEFGDMLFLNNAGSQFKLL